MKLAEAKRLMREAAGYRVSFERREGGLLVSDFFPDRDEPTIPSLDEAWKLATEFAAVDPSHYVNVYVIVGHDWTPVEGYQSRKLNWHPPQREGAHV
jgi:hypothetical protein